MMRAAHAGSEAGVVGRHTKILRRLGVSPEPRMLNGPVTLNVRMCGNPVESYESNELRKGCTLRVFCTSDLRRKATLTACGPAFTGTRTLNWSSIRSDRDSPRPED